MFPNLRFGTRMWALFLFTFVAVVIGLINVEIGLISDDQAMHRLQDQSLARMQQIKRVSDAYGLDVVDTTFRVRNYLIDWPEGAATVRAAQADVQNLWAQIKRSRLTPAEQRLVQQVEQARLRADRAISTQLAILETRDIKALGHFADTELYPAIDPVTERLKVFAALQMDAAAHEIEQQKNAKYWLRVRVYLLFAFGVVMMLLFGHLLLRDIDRGVQSLVQVARGVQTLRYDIQPDFEPRADLGEVMAAFKAMRDAIVAQQQSLQQREAEARAAKQSLQHIADNVPGMVFQLRLAPDGSAHLPFVSGGSLDLLGVSNAEAMQSSAAIFGTVAPEDLPGLMEAIHVSAKDSTPFRHEIRCRHVYSGEERWIYVQSSPQMYPEADGSSVWNGYFSDITDQKRLQQEVAARTAETKAAQERLLRIADNIPGAVYQFRVDSLGNMSLVFANRGITVHGVTADEALADFGKVAAAVVEEDQAAWLASIQEAVAGNKAWHHEYRVRLPDGQIRWVRGQSEPAPMDDGAQHFFGFIVDITAQKELQAELARAKEAADDANRAKSTFLATMSHEIRTPMIGVTGMVEILSHTGLDAEQRRCVAVIQQSAQSLLQIIGGILDFSKIEAGKLEIVPATISVGGLVEAISELFIPPASSKGLILTYEIDPRLAAAHVADPVRIRQILSNFLSNALKFTEQGGVDVRLRVLHDTGTTQRLEFSVRDQGIGISAENQGRLFQPFSQAEASTTRRFGGTGLGLTICRRLAELMGGEISLQSREGEGTTMYFRLDLPVGDAAKIEAVETAGVAAVPGRKLPTRAQAEAEGSLLLLAEDHPTNRLVLGQQFKLAGFVVDIAVDGEQALAMWRLKPYALVFTDLHMPKMDGAALAAQIRAVERAENRRRIPVLALTAAAMREEAVRCFEAGMDDVVIKPVSVPTLLAKLRQWLPQLDWGESALATLEDAELPAEAHHHTDDAAAGTELDEAALRVLAGGDGQMAKNILDDFLASTHGDVEGVALLLSARDAEAVRRQAHRIKGAALMVGALALSELAAKLEAAGKASDWAAISALLPKIDAALRRLDDHAAQRR